MPTAKTYTAMPQPMPASTEEASPSQPGSMRSHSFSGDCLDLRVHFHVLDLGRQLYIWVGTGSAAQAARMDNLAVAMPALATSAAVPPASSSLVRGPGDEVAAGLSRKLVQKLHKPVALSWSLPAADPLQTAWAQRELMTHLQQLGYMTADGIQ